jgi:hypothetical protein
MGLRQPTFASVVKLARALGVTCEAFADCDDIMADEAPPTPEPRRPGRPHKPADPEPPGQAEAPEGKAAKKGRRKA